MGNIQQLQHRLDNGELIILDGAMGTELERLGATMHNGVWCAEALGNHPELVRATHERYIQAGADIITTNTYATARHALQPAGLDHRVEEWNSVAVQLAMEARDQRTTERPIYIAGSVAPFNNWSEYNAENMKTSYQEQVQILANCGVDLLLLEMLATTVENTTIAIAAAKETGLPIWVSLSCVIDHNTNSIMLGLQESQQHDSVRRLYEPLADAITQVMQVGGSALLLMHSDFNAVSPGLDVMRTQFNGPLGVYPNAGYWQRPSWIFVDQVTPEAYLTEAKHWVNQGAQIVGGCCGTTPEQIQALRDGLF